FGGWPGILVIGGTGSVAFGRARRGPGARAGGLGPLLGDEGSAFWIGREWLRTRPEREALAFAHRADPVRAVAALATRVLWAARSGRGAERRAARRIAARAQQALALQARAAAGRLHFSGPAPLSWHGGLLRDADFRAGVLSRLGRRLRPSPPREEPPLFAARMALGFARMGRSWHSSARSAARAR
ncbi:MAG: hypothetical protein HY554_16320, partial [Elusimicrobia bacterium]|nr:hypothetical protein [Elusimicrobiota bacterium]